MAVGLWDDDLTQPCLTKDPLKNLRAFDSVYPVYCTDLAKNITIVKYEFMCFVMIGSEHTDLYL